MDARSRQVLSVISRRTAAALPAARFGLGPARIRRAAFARALRESFEELGPAYVKIGQLVSVRPDVFSAELVTEMEKLQDSAAPMPLQTVAAVVREELGAEPHELFDAFEREPMASASMAQVHGARLREAARPVFGAELPAGTPVVVKILRPGARESLLGDVESARRLSAGLRRWGLLRAVDTESLIGEFEESVERESDMRIEGRIADRFRFDFRDDDRIMVPSVVWTLTSRRVMTMERVTGWSLSELVGADAPDVDAYGLALHGATAFMRQVLVHGRFHADLHHANLLVTPDNRIAYLDFGIVGFLSPQERRHVAMLLAALVYRDAGAALTHSRELGVVVPEASVPALTRDLGRLMDATLAGSQGSDVRGFGLGFLRLLRRHGIAIPTGYGLLVKSLVTVEGVSRALYPQIDIIEASKPFVTALVARTMLTPEEIARRLPKAVAAGLREMLS